MFDAEVVQCHVSGLRVMNGVLVKKSAMHSVSTLSAPLAQEDVQKLGMQFCKARWLQKFWTDPILLFHFQAVSKFLIDWIVCVSSMLLVENVQMAFPFFVCHFVTR